MHNIHTLPNGLRIAHFPLCSPVAYVGIAIDAGTRDELADESGMAHFTEHMMFKGTERRSAYAIIDRLESVGGRLDAYTTKEETYVYAAVPAPYTARAVSLMADVVLHSTFPEREIERERTVVLEEIDSYRDSPAELIYDDFEERLFPDDPLGRNILGTAESLATFTTGRMQAYVRRNFTADRLLLFYMGPAADATVLRLAERYLGDAPRATRPRAPYPEHKPYVPFHETVEMDTNQIHCIIGTKTPGLASPDRYRMMLVNNILGGPNLTSRLNMALREHHGYCYTVESSLTCYSDTGLFQLYFGTDAHNIRHASQLAMAEILRMVASDIEPRQLARAKEQLKGQVLIAERDEENTLLAITRQILHHEQVRTNAEILAEIDTYTPAELRAAACLMLDNLSVLIYK